MLPRGVTVLVHASWYGVKLYTDIQVALDVA